MFTGHDGPAAMNVYWSVAIFTSDWTSGPVGSSLPVLLRYLRQLIASSILESYDSNPTICVKFH